MGRTAGAWIMAALMCAASAAGVSARPNAKLTPIHLEGSIPPTFGDWKTVPQPAQIPDPSTKRLLETLYAEVVTRTYVNEAGDRIMLSVAYGSDQTGGLQAHRPEVCYPAQGLQLLGAFEDGVLTTLAGDLPVRRMRTNMGSRYEPVTYWLTAGNRVRRSQLDVRMEQVRLVMTGQIPDGVLFRVSSIDKDSAHAFAVQQKFVADLVTVLPAEPRRRLTGLPPTGLPG